MELPKNIVQIGNPDKRYKVFVEDYVVSYIKEINRSLYGGQAGLAFYGKKYIENEIQYCFVYGAAEIFGLEGRGQYLSEKERELIEAKRLEFFEELELQAWCTLGGDIPDGFYLLDQGKGVWVSGYATFFEKNENMLNFMLIMGKRENRHVPKEDVIGRLAEGGNIDHRIMERSQKLSEFRKSGEYRNRLYDEKRSDKYEKNGSWKTVVVGMVVMFCVIGIAALSDETKMQNFQVVARKIWANLGEQKLPDVGEEIVDNFQAPDTIVATEEPSEKESETLPLVEDNAEDVELIETPAGETITPETESAEAEHVEPVEDVTDETETEPVISQEIQTDKTITYIVKKGDALLTICRNYYGSEARLKEICELNQIEDPDDIKVGQTILLPE